MKAVGFTRETAERILKTVDAVEAAPNKTASEPGRRASIDVYHVQLTSLTTVSGRYPGKRYTYDPASSTWTSHDDVWVVEANGTALALGTKYPAYRNAVADGRPVWVVSVAAGVSSINGDTTAAQFLAVDSAAAGADLNISAAAAAYDPLKVYYKGQVASYAGSTYRYINTTPGDGVSLSNTSYWEDITGKGLIVVNVPQGSFTSLSGDFTHNAKPGETIVVSTVGGTAGNSIINLPADTDSNAYGYETGRPGAEVVIKYVEWDAGTYLKITGACIYDSGDADPYHPLTIHGDAGYTPGTDFLEPSAMVFRWTQSYSHAPVCRWILAAAHNLVREDGLHAGSIYYTRPPGASATTAGLTFRRGFYAGGTVSVGTAEGGTGVDTSGVTDGQILIGKTSDHSWNLATLTAGSGITITNGGGTITIAATGGGGGASGAGTDNHLVRWDGTTAIQDSGIVIDDSDNVAGMASLTLPYNTLKLKDSDASHTLAIVNSSNLSADRQLSIATNDANRTVTLTGDLAMSGSHNLTLTMTGDTNVTFPTSGVLINEARFDKVSPAAIQNLNLYVTASAGALTVAVKTNAGSNPSSTDYCVIPFRYTTTYVSDFRYRKITSSMSLTIPSGATLGTANGKACRVWIGAVDSLVDAIPETGTIQLFAINCYDGASTIYPLRDNEMANPTAIGTGSDSAGVMYSPATVSGVARAIRILGYLEWPSGISTAGTWTWASSDEIAQLYHPGVPLPGDRIQVAVSTDAAGSNGTTAIPADDTIPQNTEGDQIQSVSIVPKSAANMLRVTGYAFLNTNTSNNTIGYCLFRDSGADAIAATWMNTSSAQNSQHEVLIFPGHLSGTTSSTTYKTRAGGYAGTTYFNRHGGSRYYGGTWYSHLIAEEVMT